MPYVKCVLQNSWNFNINDDFLYFQLIFTCGYNPNFYSDLIFKMLAVNVNVGLNYLMFSGAVSFNQLTFQYL